jgi:mannose-1-phosphate guanylyltransferase
MGKVSKKMEDITNHHFYAVIMAGGGGTRLWPLSRKSSPKQMLQLVGERTLYQMAVDRLIGLFPPDHIFVVTAEDQASQLQEQSPQIPGENFLLEPMPRGTASVVGFAAIALHNLDHEATMAVLTADHFIENTDRFQQVLLSAYQLAQQDSLITLGICPVYPSTGYGYIHRGKAIGEYHGSKAYKVLEFKEKPDIQKAEEFLASGDYDWNSGMFIWRVDNILREFQLQMPDLYQTLDRLKKAWNEKDRDKVLAQIWPEIKPETIDYGIMEHARNIAVFPVEDLGWNDVGSWDSIFEVLPVDENQNIILNANHVGIETSSSLVFTKQAKRLIVTIDVKDLVIVDTDDAILVCSREQAQKVRDVVKLLARSGYNNYL